MPGKRLPGEANIFTSFTITDNALRPLTLLGSFALQIRINLSSECNLSLHVVAGKALLVYFPPWLADLRPYRVKPH